MPLLCYSAIMFSPLFVGILLSLELIYALNYSHCSTQHCLSLQSIPAFMQTNTVAWWELCVYIYVYDLLIDTKRKKLPGLFLFPLDLCFDFLSKFCSIKLQLYTYLVWGWWMKNGFCFICTIQQTTSFDISDKLYTKSICVCDPFVILSSQAFVLTTRLWPKGDRVGVRRAGAGFSAENCLLCLESVLFKLATCCTCIICGNTCAWVTMLDTEFQYLNLFIFIKSSDGWNKTL